MNSPESTEIQRFFAVLARWSQATVGYSRSLAEGGWAESLANFRGPAGFCRSARVDLAHRLGLDDEIPGRGFESPS